MRTFFIPEMHFFCIVLKQGNPSGIYGAHCAFEIALSPAITLTLLLVSAFSPRVHSIPRGPCIFARNDIKCVARNNFTTK